MDNLILLCQQLYRCMPRFKRLTQDADTAETYDWPTIEQIVLDISVLYDQHIFESTDDQSQKDLLLIVSRLVRFKLILPGDHATWDRNKKIIDDLEQWLQLHNHMPQP